MYDYVIVGAGPAGCVLANRLSARPELRVLLLEAGAPDRRKEIAIPAAFPSLFRTDLDWGYWTSPQPELKHRNVYLPRGKTLGGSSSINAMIHTRGHPSDFDRWAETSGPQWSYAKVAPIFDRIERCDSGSGRAAGLMLEGLREPNPLTRAFLHATIEAGLRVVTSPDASQPGSAGLPRVTQRRGRRWSAADAYLRPVSERHNLTVRTGVRVTRILFEGKRAVGVSYLRGEGPEEVRASREVLLCAGAFNSPHLLLLSGVGPGDHLRSFGIEPVHEAGGVGENYQDHLMVVLKWRSPRNVSLRSAARPANLARYLLFRRGPLTSNVGEAIAFLGGAFDGDAPSIELIFGPVLWDLMAPPTEHGFSIGAILLQPRSVGTVRLGSASPLEAPRIDPCFLSEPGDMATLLSGVKAARRIGEGAALAAWRGAEVAPGAGRKSDAELEEFIRTAAETIFHPVGTCRMGSDPASVVDPDLRVRGVEALRVVDASVMPSIPRAHPCAAVLAIAQRAADLVLEQGGREEPAVFHRGA